MNYLQVSKTHMHIEVEKKKKKKPQLCKVYKLSFSLLSLSAFVLHQRFDDHNMFH